MNAAPLTKGITAAERNILPLLILLSSTLCIREPSRVRVGALGRYAAAPLWSWAMAPTGGPALFPRRRANSLITLSFACAHRPPHHAPCDGQVRRIMHHATVRWVFSFLGGGGLHTPCSSVVGSPFDSVPPLTQGPSPLFGEGPSSCPLASAGHGKGSSLGGRVRSALCWEPRSVLPRSFHPP